ncbi:hypothetical protein EL324_07310 [Vibrio cholerae]|nr:hypothetical protein O3Y_07170 [Vibrio cholerae IEC224]AUR69725.1 hypothetical protein C1H56_06415 [Vibrio cholerae]OFJ23694.1 hypothetical protein BFX30_07460 [Vibrio cholerae C6706]RXN79553.1 hypothetical protein D0515_05800 [Vibrio cholerae O1 biovar El Tor]KPA03070.1 hypothetical protein AC096_05320 [Vibrio cholerae]
MWNAHQEALLNHAITHSQTANSYLQHCVLSHFNPKVQEAIKKLSEAFVLMEDAMKDPYNTRGNSQ